MRGTDDTTCHAGARLRRGRPAARNRIDREVDAAPARARRRLACDAGVHRAVLHRDRPPMPRGHRAAA